MPQMWQAAMPQLQTVAGGGDSPVQSVNNIDELVNRFGNDENESGPATAPTTITMIVPLQTNSQNNNIVYSGIATPKVCLSTGLRVSYP